MAIVIGANAAPTSGIGGRQTELQVLRELEQALTDAYTIVHGVEWAAMLDGNERHGELDLVVIGPSGDVLMLEIKAGDVEVTPQGIFKQYDNKREAVHGQVSLQYGAMRSRLQKAGLACRVSVLLVLPHAVISSETAYWPRERIVSAPEMPHLTHRVREALPAGEPNDALRAQATAFFSNLLRLQPDVSALAGHLQQATTVLSDGLATWVPRIQAPSGVIRVVGTAGSGKTQLALKMLRDAETQGLRAAYVCFNRALADHMGLLVPPRFSAETFHEIADRLYRAANGAPDFTRQGIFAELEAHAIGELGARQPDLDFLVLDEMQDLKPEWVQSLMGRLRANGRALLLEDPEQNLYADRDSFDIDGEVLISAPENYRSPRVVVDLVNALGLTETSVAAAGPTEGSFQEPRVYASDEGAVNETARAVQACIDMGFSLDQIAVVSFRGRERSAILSLDELGPWPLRRPTGAYDAGGAALWTAGTLLADTVFRFKGQSAPAVVFTEIDFAEWTPSATRRLFVGLTRARVHWEWVMSEGAQRLIAGRLA